MEVNAKARYIRMSPKKVRLVIDVVRGMDIAPALAQLKFINKRAATPVEKLIKSAVANAMHNFELKEDNLFIKEIRADDGPTLKRWHPRAFGRAGSIRKRSVHITLILGEKVETKKDVKGKKEKLAAPKKVEELVNEEIKKEENKDVDKNKSKDDDVNKEIKDEKEKGKHRHNEHLDKLREKEKGGFAKKIFRRKAG
jgi:large subunit ribosomal protein L22